MNPRRALSIAAALLLAPAQAAAQTAPDPNKASEYVEVTTSRIPEEVEIVPASVTVITRQELRDRGATDLRTALLFAAGVEISPGGDAGPASSVPEFWGLREFDAFLLVVDGVPWGGAFNPSLSTIDLADVERIEVLRGAAPVMYGATSFVGVIQILRRAAGEGETTATAKTGSFGGGGVGASTPLPMLGTLASTLAADVESVNFRDDRTGVDRGHILWRGGTPLGSGRLRLDADAIWIGQDPASPQPRVGRVITSLVPLDSNHNPDDAHLDERRLFFVAGYDHPLPGTSGTFATALSFTRSDQGIFRGFLTDVSNVSPNANGFREAVSTADLYFDAHGDFHVTRTVRIVAGVDHLHGLGTGRGGDFDYFIPLDGDNAPSPSSLPSAADVKIRDRREFSGAYGFVEWTPVDRWRLELGARLNRTVESRSVNADQFGVGVTKGADRSEVMRGSGAAGATYTAWQRKADAVHIYADYRDTYKPAAIDFGIDSEPEILEPETAQSYEVGSKARLLGGKLQPEISVFRMDFRNLVVDQISGGLPVLVNAGRERFQGVETSIGWSVTPNLLWRTGWSFHNARFRDFVQDFGGVPTQLSGNRLEMSPRTMGSTGLVYARPTGWVGFAQVGVVGNRYLNKRNTALVSPYATVAAGIGYRIRSWELRLDGWNLTNQRPPVSESEMGDAQYYRLPATRVVLSATFLAGAKPSPAKRS
ncbi:MAG: TonB-dependent receptor [Acidobacteria bacterium]|nr:TonB-dependent receptor [Acidobacteriota bacterium]